MKYKFKNLPELLDFFKQESTCKKALEIQRWQGKITCPHCEKYGIITNEIYITNRGYRCAEKTCQKKFSVTVGTIMENTKVPLRLWFAAIYIVTAHKKGISSHQLGRDIGVTQKTAWFMLCRIREIMKNNNSSMLNGLVEIDEAYIGGKRKNMHKFKKEQLLKGTGAINKVGVFGMLERGGNVVTSVMTGSYSHNLKPLIREAVSTTATLITDGFKGYKGLIREFQDHQILRHENEEYVRGNFHTNSIEGFWSLLKRGIIGIYHSVSPKHLHRYCNEFAYRYNLKGQTDQERFFNSLTRISISRLTYKDLIK